MNLNPKAQFIVSDEPEILASYEVVREVINGITIDSSAVTATDGKKTIQKGMPLAKLANGKYVPYNPAGVDGSQSPSVILKASVDVTDGDHVVGGYEVAKVITERIPVAVDDALRGKMPLITFS
ncbi:head decoration protein [Planomicrobium sp. MB-3u-38]|uniref:head decoration protein n=1 Tax=Planomicrobium sp. MB-3u-38 TaxID=2058318 RepID=UPI000C7D4CEC|nr:head decoration protein [Planomicrobium sp. MB-3u-38]PKH09855.1 head decoration protein [Planomicrobium sp. MB-3u-38]